MSDGAGTRRPRLILRVAAAVATFQAGAHLTLFLRSQPKPGSAVWSLAQIMRAQAAPGHTDYWAMYFGYGLLSAVTAVLIAALIWLAASFDEGSRTLARWLVVILLAAVIVHAAVIARYFFPVPLYFDIVVAVLLALSLTAMRDLRAS